MAKLAIEINSKRKEMIHLGLHKGLSAEETVRCSQELDELLNLYQEEKEREKNKKIWFTDYLFRV